MAIVFSGVLTAVIGLAIKYTIGLRLAEEDEVEGIDFVAHGESAYDIHTSGGGGSHERPRRQDRSRSRKGRSA